jgi:hypothetical protein
LQGFLFQIDEAEIVAHKANDPTAFVDFLDSEPLASALEMVTRFLCMQVRPQAVTSAS